MKNKRFTRKVLQLFEKIYIQFTKHFENQLLQNFKRGTLTYLIIRKLKSYTL